MTVVLARSEDSGDLHDYGQIGLLFVDGWHTLEAVKRDIQDWVPRCGPTPIVIFDDWSDDGIFDAILSSRSILPTHCIAVGKDLLFSDLVYFRSFSFRARLSLLRIFEKLDTNKVKLKSMYQS